MATHVEQAVLVEPKTESISVRSSWPVLLPYSLGILALTPMLALYFRQLWGRPHYQIFPLALIALFVFAVLRWPRGEVKKFQSSRTGTFFLLVGFVCGLLSFLFVEPWFAAASAACLTASLFARTIDHESHRSLLPLSLLAFFCVIPPLDGTLYFDQRLITWLQRVSASFTSQILDLVGYAHYMPGTTFLAPGGANFEIEQACSGIQSFFTLLAFAILFIIAFRRPWFRAFLLLVSAGFWAIFMNTVRILAIPTAKRMFEWDLASGPAHEMLGYITLGIGVILVLSTDQLLFFLFGPVETFGDEGGGVSRRIVKFWNKVVSGVQDSSTSTRRRRREMSSLTRSLIWGAAIVLLVGGIWNASDVVRSLQSSSLKVRFFDSNVVVPLAEQDMPLKIGNWSRVEGKYQMDDRARGSDLGQHQDRWFYQSPGMPSLAVSLDQTFPGWHELTTCYRNQGWDEVPNSRVSKKPQEGSPGQAGWDFVICDFTRDTGEHGFLVFSHFDAYGEGFEAPRSWDLFTSVTTRAMNRLNHRIRSRLFRGEAYQSQVFVQTFGVINDAMKEEIVNFYMQAREILRTQFIARHHALDTGTPLPSDTKSEGEATKPDENAKTEGDAVASPDPN